MSNSTTAAQQLSNITWAHAIKNSDNGNNPAIAINNQNVAVQVYRSRSDRMYQVGAVNSGGTINWGLQYSFSNDASSDSTPIGLGINNNNVAVVVYADGSDLKYRLGNINPNNKTISFGDSHKYDSGLVPKVAINDNNVVAEIHVSDNPFSTTSYTHIGIADPSGQTIDFGSSQSHDGAENPCIAINNQNTVVEIHMTNAATSSMWCAVGTADPNSKNISWGTSVNFDNGANPAVSLNNNFVVSEVHAAGNLSSALWNTIGTVDPNGKTIAWNKPFQFDSGNNVSIGINDNDEAVEIHNAGTTSSAIWCSTGFFSD